MSHETATASLNTRPEISEMLPNNCETLPFPTIFDSPQDRIGFLSHVYNSGDRRRYAELAVGTSAPRGVFELPQDVFEDYIAAITDTSPRPELRGKIRLQNLFATTPPDDPSLNAERPKARQVSISGESVRGLAIDPLKIERFGLQQRFIREQQVVLLGDAVAVEETPFAIRLRELGEARLAQTSGAAQDGRGFAADISQAFDEASELLVDRYSTDREPNEGYDGLTEEQKFALRYKEVAKITQDLRVLGSYISPREYDDDASAAMIAESISKNIWGVSKGGAGLPLVIPGLLHYIQGLAIQDFDIHPTIVELEQIALERRNEIAAIALQQTSDFVASLPGHFPQSLRASSLSRNDNDELELRGSVKPRYAGVREYYPAIDLGCPVLRERRAPVSIIANQSKPVHFIDNLIAVSIHEASRRGLFLQQSSR